MDSRRITLRLYPTVAQAAAMEAIKLSHQQLYNAALEERRDAWRKSRTSITFVQQCRSLTVVRRENPEYAAVIQKGQNLTLRRVDLAMRAFYRRVKAGQAPGYPRFKAADRYPGWSLGADEGYRYLPKVTASGRWFNGKLRLTGVGAVRARGKARCPAKAIKIVDILHRQGQWFASLVCDVDARRFSTGEAVAGLDWGVKSLATLAYGPGDYAEVPNDRLFQAQAEKAREAARAASKALRGRRSATAKRKRQRIAKLQRHLANRRLDRSHKLSARLATTHRRIVTEELRVANITRSAKGTVEAPGRQVAQKAGLNREILDTAPGMLMGHLRYKAEEAGCALTVIDTRRHKPSQTCPMCLARRKKALAERGHTCPCGFTATRDQAAALLMLRVGLQLEGQELAWGATPEYQPTAA